MGDNITKNLSEKLAYLRPPDTSLALFRIILGISVFYSLLVVRFPDFRLLYGSDRLFPVEIARHWHDLSTLSVFDVIYSDVFASAFLLAGMGGAILFTLGKWTRPAGAAALFVLWNCLQSDAIYAFGFDHYTFNILLCGLFLPLNNAWSLDSMKPGFQRREPSVSFTMVVLIQVAAIYFTTGILKTGASWIHGYAVRNMLSDPYTVSGLGAVLRDMPAFYIPSNYVTLLFEISAPLFIFARTRKHWLRWAGTTAILGFHVLVLLTYKVGNFPISGIAVACLLIPVDLRTAIRRDDGIPGKVDLDPGSQILDRMKRFAAVAWAAVIISSCGFYVSSQEPYSSSPLVRDIAGGLKLFRMSPVETGPFYQKWTMFAPNPFAYTGWIAVEQQTGSGNVELTSGKPASMQGPVYDLDGWMFYMVYYSRKWNKHDNPKYFLFVKYWILHILEKKGLSPDDPTVVLVDYERHLLLKAGADYIEPLEVKPYPVSDILKYPLRIDEGNGELK